jgi:hypothetical protein
LLPGGSASKTEDYRIWGKPVRAVAEGTVESWFDGMETNTVLGKLPDPTLNPVARNHFWIRHDNVTVGGDTYVLQESFNPQDPYVIQTVLSNMRLCGSIAQRKRWRTPFWPTLEIVNRTSSRARLIQKPIFTAERTGLIRFNNTVWAVLNQPSALCHRYSSDW